MKSLTKEKIKIAIVDDAQIIRDGAKSVLESNPGIEVVSCAGNGKELMEFLQFPYPEIILLDAEMPIMSGAKTLEILAMNFPAIKVIMYSMYLEHSLLERYKKMGAFGFVPKGSDDKVLVNTIYSVYRNVKTYNEEISSELLTKQKGKKEFLNTDKLSQRELEVMNLVCLCKSNKQMADILCVTERTIEFHKTKIYKKTGMLCTSDLILYAIKNGLMVL